MDDLIKNNGTLDSQDFTEFYLNKKVDYFRDFILFSFFYLSRKPDEVTFLKIKYLISEILLIDDFLDNNCSFLEFITKSAVGKYVNEDDFFKISKLVDGKFVSKQFLPLYYQYLAERSFSNKDGYFAAKLMELAIKISIESFPFSSYDTTEMSDGFLNFLSGIDCQKFLFEKQKVFLERDLSLASTDEEISAIQKKIQLLLKLIYK
jgi:hypothetical protein